MKKKFLGLLIIFTFLLSFSVPVWALDKESAIQAYSDELVALGAEKTAADEKATSEVLTLILGMQTAQSDANTRYDNMKERVDTLLKSDLRQEEAKKALDEAKKSEEEFSKLSPDQSIFVQVSVAGAPPSVTEDENFNLAQQSFEDSIGRINRILLAPTRPGTVPTGDIVSDFIPQIIRQLFRFAWVAVLLAFTVSGIMLIIAFDDEERITKAKGMIYFTLIGFAFITLAFAVVKAVTNIDFFNFV